MKHADPIDVAAEQEQKMIEVALANRPGPIIKFTGKCHFCEEKINKGHYCNNECRDDHDRQLWAKRNRKVI